MRTVGRAITFVICNVIFGTLIVACVVLGGLFFRERAV